MYNKYGAPVLNEKLNNFLSLQGLTLASNLSQIGLVSFYL